MVVGDVDDARCPDYPAYAHVDGYSRWDSTENVKVVQCFRTHMADIVQDPSKFISLDIVGEFVTEFVDSVDLLALEHPGHFFDLSEAAGRAPSDDFRQFSGVESSPESCGRFRIRPSSNKSLNPRLNRIFVVLSSL